MVFYQRLNLLKSKIALNAKQIKWHALVLASLVLAFYFWPFIILVGVSLFGARRFLKGRFLLLVIGLFILLYLAYYVFLLIPYLPTKGYIIKKVATQQGYSYIIRAGLFKYRFWLSDNLAVGTKIAFKATIVPQGPLCYPYALVPWQQNMAQLVKGQLKISEYQVLHKPWLNIDKYWTLYGPYTKEWCLVFLRDQSFSDNAFLSFLKEINLMRLVVFSGFHLGVIIYFLKKIFFYTSLPLKGQNIILGLLLLMGSFITNSVTFKRYLVMFILALFLNINKQTRLALTFIILTILFPYQIYHPSFVMGFVGSWGWTFLATKLKTYHPLLRKIGVIYLMQLLLLPFILRYYNRFNLVLFLVLPLILIIFKYVLFPLTFVSLVIPPSGVILEGFLKGVHYLFKEVRVINFTFAIPTMNYYLMSLYYLCIFFLFFLKNYQRCFALSIIVLVLFLNYWQFYLSPFSKAFFFDVGQGNFSLVYDSKSKKTLVVDLYGNPLSICDKLGLRRIDYLILTHSDNDHIAGYNQVRDYLPISNIYGSPYDNYQKINLIPQKPTINSSYGPGNLTFTFLGPLFAQKTPNQNSLVVMVELDKKRLLYTGDITKDEEQALVNCYGSNLKADLLMVSHHGSKDSSIHNFLVLVAPYYGIISCGVNNRYGHPHVDTLKRLKSNNIIPLQTALNQTLIYYPKSNKTLLSKRLSLFYY